MSAISDSTSSRCSAKFSWILVSASSSLTQPVSCASKAARGISAAAATSMCSRISGWICALAASTAALCAVPSRFPLAVAGGRQPLHDVGDEIAAGQRRRRRSRAGPSRPAPPPRRCSPDRRGSAAPAVPGGFPPPSRAVSSSRARASPSSIDKALASGRIGRGGLFRRGALAGLAGAVDLRMAARKLGDAGVQPALRPRSSEHRNHRVPSLRLTVSSSRRSCAFA